jgi:hypothetical protein
VHFRTAAARAQRVLVLFQETQTSRAHGRFVAQNGELVEPTFGGRAKLRGSAPGRA